MVAGRYERFRWELGTDLGGSEVLKILCLSLFSAIVSAIKLYDFQVSIKPLFWKQDEAS